MSATFTAEIVRTGADVTFVHVDAIESVLLRLSMGAVGPTAITAAALCVSARDERDS